jgi:hypothetical protein
MLILVQGVVALIGFTCCFSTLFYSFEKNFQKTLWYIFLILS